jgi:hypothetical protein
MFLQGQNGEDPPTIRNIPLTDDDLINFFGDYRKPQGNTDPDGCKLDVQNGL